MWRKLLRWKGQEPVELNEEAHPFVTFNLLIGPAALDAVHEVASWFETGGIIAVTVGVKMGDQLIRHEEK